jgi:hypothetical protein
MILKAFFFPSLTLWKLSILLLHHRLRKTMQKYKLVIKLPVAIELIPFPKIGAELRNHTEMRYLDTGEPTGENDIKNNEQSHTRGKVEIIPNQIPS